MKITNTIKNHPKMFLGILLILVVTTIAFVFKIQDLKYEILNQKAIPGVELINYLSVDSKNIVSGGVVGFVKFNNKIDQPKDLEQYIKIEALDKFDLNGNQIFLHQDIIKMKYLAPHYFDPVYLTVIDNSGGRITLSDKDSNLFFIDKYTKEVGMFDNTSDKTILITSDSDFSKFIRGF